MERWRDEMSWGKARQGRREKPKGEKKNEKEKTQQEDNCSRYLRYTLSRALKLFFFFFGSSPCIFFYSRAR